MNWNLREKLEQARAADRSGRGLPEDPSPWRLREEDGEAETDTLLDVRVFGNGTPERDGDLPVWTGEPTGATAMRNAAGTNYETSTAIVQDGDECTTCGEAIRTELVDLVNGVTHLSCTGCGRRHLIECPA